MRAAIRARVNQLFVHYPSLGRLGYDLLRKSGLDRSTQGVKNFLQRVNRQGFDPQTILDVGANHGGWSREVRPLFPHARFFLIEPQIEMTPFLDHFTAHSPGSRWFLGGAGAVEAEAALTIWEDRQGSSFLTPEIQALVPGKQQRIVPIFTIDGLVQAGQMPVPDLIKIDVQGYELEVLRGALTCLGRSDMLIVETSLFHPFAERPTYYRVVELMEAYGYRIFDLLDLRYRPRDGALWQVDICFLRRDSPLAVQIKGGNIRPAGSSSSP